MDPSAAAIANRRIVVPPVGFVLVLMISAIIGPPIRPYPDGLGGLFARCSLWVRSGHAATVAGRKMPNAAPVLARLANLRKERRWGAISQSPPGRLLRERPCKSRAYGKISTDYIRR